MQTYSPFYNRGTTKTFLMYFYEPYHRLWCIQWQWVIYNDSEGYKKVREDTNVNYYYITIVPIQCIKNVLDSPYEILDQLLIQELKSVNFGDVKWSPYVSVLVLLLLRVRTTSRSSDSLPLCDGECLCTYGFWVRFESPDVRTQDKIGGPHGSQNYTRSGTGSIVSDKDLLYLI